MTDSTTPQGSAAMPPPTGNTQEVLIGGWRAGKPVPQPTLTDAEREAVSVAFGIMNERAAKLQDRPDTREAARPFIKWARALQGLFERPGGGE